MVMTANLVTAVGNASSNSAVTDTKKADNTVKGTSFEQFMSQKDSKDNISDVNQKDTGTKKDANMTTDKVKEKPLVEQKKDVETTEEAKGKADKAEKIEQPGTQDESVLSIDELTEEQKLAMESAIISAISQALNISPEDLSKMLEETGIEPLELLDSENLMNFFMKMNGLSEPVEILANEQLTEDFTKLKEAVEQVELPEIDSTKILPVNQPQVEKVDTQISNEAAIDMEKAVEETVVSNSPKQQAESEKQKDVKEKHPEVIVEKETTANETVTAKTETMDSNPKQSREEQKQPNETNENTLQSFVENLAVKGQQTAQDMSVVEKRVEIMRNIVEQIVEQIKISVKPDTTSMEIQLNPENLGKVSLSVVSKNGQMTATITTQTEIAKEAIEGQIHMLRENLSNQGLKVEAVEVNVSDFQFGFGQNRFSDNSQNSSGKRGNRRKIDLSEFDEKAEDVTEEEILAAKVMRDNGGSVDYTA